MLEDLSCRIRHLLYRVPIPMVRRVPIHMVRRVPIPKVRRVGRAALSHRPNYAGLGVEGILRQSWWSGMPTVQVVRSIGPGLLNHTSHSALAESWGYWGCRGVEDNLANRWVHGCPEMAQN